VQKKIAVRYMKLNLLDQAYDYLVKIMVRLASH